MSRRSTPADLKSAFGKSTGQLRLIKLLRYSNSPGFHAIFYLHIELKPGEIKYPTLQNQTLQRPK